jgi:hypothetical protein
VRGGPAGAHSTPRSAGRDAGPRGGMGRVTGPAYSASVHQAAPGKCEVAHSDAEKSRGGPERWDSGEGRQVVASLTALLITQGGMDIAIT